MGYSSYMLLACSAQRIVVSSPYADDVLHEGETQEKQPLSAMDTKTYV